MRRKPLAAAAAASPLLLAVLAALLLASARAAGVGADGNATLACANRTLAPSGSAANCSAPAPAPEAVARTYVDVYGDYFIAFGVLFVASLVWCAWYARHRRAAWWSLLPLHVIYLGVGDTFSDFTFIAQMSTKQLDWSAVRTSAFVLTCLAALLNVVVMVWYLRRIVLNNEPKHRPFIRWLQVHRHVVVALLLFSLSSARFLTLMYSSLFELAMFSAPLPVSAMEAIDLISLITVLVEDLPQLAFVVYVSEVGDQGWDNFAITAVAFSLIIIAVTTSSRWCTLVFYLNKEHRANDAVYADHAKGACASERARRRAIARPGPSRRRFLTTASFMFPPTSALSLRARVFAQAPRPSRRAACATCATCTTRKRRRRWRSPPRPQPAAPLPTLRQAPRHRHRTRRGRLLPPPRPLRSSTRTSMRPRTGCPSRRCRGSSRRCGRSRRATAACARPPRHLRRRLLRRLPPRPLPGLARRRPSRRPRAGSGAL